MSVGKSLRDARLAKNLSIAEVATAIRIRASIVQDIEEDSFDSCGGEVYGRGHQRMYARFLGLDIEDKIVNTPSIETEFESNLIRPSMLKPLGAKTNWSVVLGLGSVVAVAMLAVIVVGNNDGINRPTTIITQDESTSDQTDEIQAEAPTTDTTSDGDLTAAVADEVNVDIEVVGDSCWLRVENSAGEVVFQGVLRSGEVRSFADSTQLSLVMGNAGGVNFTLNGVSLGAPGGLGEVLRLTVLPGQTTITP
jgi:cytoskeleton protein RodZ